MVKRHFLKVQTEEESATDKTIFTTCFPFRPITIDATVVTNPAYWNS